MRKRRCVRADLMRWFRSVVTRGIAGAIVVALATAMAGSGAFARARKPHVVPSPTVTPVPTPLATPAPTQAARLETMRERLAEIARAAPGRLGIAIYDVATEERFSIRGGEAFALAGVSRLPTAVVAYRLADQKRFRLDDRVFVTRGDFRRGSSEIARDHPRGGIPLTYWELLRAMLVTGDTTASDVVLRAIGGPAAVQRVLDRAGVRGIALRKSEAELASDARVRLTFARGADNRGTPDGVADLLVGIATQRFTLLDSTSELLYHLSNARIGPDRLRAGLPATIRLAHASGTSDTFDGTTEATNDVGLLTLPDGRRIAVVALLAASNADDATRAATLARVARTVADAYGP